MLFIGPSLIANASTRLSAAVRCVHLRLTSMGSYYRKPNFHSDAIMGLVDHKIGADSQCSE